MCNYLHREAQRGQTPVISVPLPVARAWETVDIHAVGNGTILPSTKAELGPFLQMDFTFTTQTKTRKK